MGVLLVALHGTSLGMSLPVASLAYSLDCNGVLRAEWTALRVRRARAKIGMTTALKRTVRHDTSCGYTDTEQRKSWWVSFVILLALTATWGLASPLFSYPDEPAHVIYAAGAVRGDLAAGTSGLITAVEVPASYAAIENPPCFAFKIAQTAACLPALNEGARGLAEVGTSAGRYPPLYYLYAGIPSVFAMGTVGIYLMRLLTAVLCAALLASAIASARACTRSSWPLVGLLLALTPMILYFSVAVNPQGPEISAGIAFWSAGLALSRLHDCRSNDTRLRTRLLLRTLVAAAVLVTARPLSPFWLLLIAIFLVIVHQQWRALRALTALRMVRVGAVVVLLLGIVTVTWVLVRDSLLQTQTTAFADLSVPKAALVSFNRTSYLLQQMVGVFGWLDTEAPAFTYIVWTGLLGAVLLAALATMQRRNVAALVGLMFAGVLIPVVLEVSKYTESGFPWQGRYTIPLLAGVPILAGHMLGKTRRVGGMSTGRLQSLMVILAASAHFVAFVKVLGRYTHGVTEDTASTLTSGALPWAPPLGSTALAVGFAIALSLGAVAVLRALTSADDCAEAMATAPEDSPPSVVESQVANTQRE